MLINRVTIVCGKLYYLIRIMCIATVFSGLSDVYTAAEELPDVKVVSVQRVFHNGEHNAFTDMCRFEGRYYLTFRSCPDGHMVFPTSSIIVLSSKDAQTWEQVHRFSVPKRDTRDPHFMVFNNRLFVYTGTWYCGNGPPFSKERDLNRHLGSTVWSAP